MNLRPPGVLPRFSKENPMNARNPSNAEAT